MRIERVEDALFVGIADVTAVRQVNSRHSLAIKVVSHQVRVVLNFDALSWPCGCGGNTEQAHSGEDGHHWAPLAQ
jgi:hypothetical protein